MHGMMRQLEGQMRRFLKQQALEINSCKDIIKDIIKDNLLTDNMCFWLYAIY